MAQVILSILAETAAAVAALCLALLAAWSMPMD
jgi:hypothetical protein